MACSLIGLSPGFWATGYNAAEPNREETNPPAVAVDRGCHLKTLRIGQTMRHWGKLHGLVSPEVFFQHSLSCRKSDRYSGILVYPKIDKRGECLRELLSNFAWKENSSFGYSYRVVYPQSVMFNEFQDLFCDAAICMYPLFLKTSLVYFCLSFQCLRIAPGECKYDAFSVCRWTQRKL